MSDLPPLPAVGTGLPAPAWLDAGQGQYTHHYGAGHCTTACGLTAPAELVRAAWAVRQRLTKSPCPLCVWLGIP